MKRSILAARLEVARERIVTAVLEAAVDPALLADLNAALAEKRAETRTLYELEALAPIIEELATAANVGGAEGDGAGLTAAEVLAIPGLTATSKRALEAYFQERDAPAD